MQVDNKDTFYLNRIKELETERKRLSDLIEHSQKELEKVEFALKAFGQSGDTDNYGVELSVSEGGSLKKVHETIIEFLRRHGKVATASDLSQALYTFRLNISVSQLKRRFSVVTSAMYKNHDPSLLIDSGLKNQSREIYWALPEWMNGNELKEEHKPE